MDNTDLRHARTHSAIGQAVTEKLHGGYAATGRTDGGLFEKIRGAMQRLEQVPTERRDERWAAATRATLGAADLLASGRRAKAGKVLADARELIKWAT